MINMHLIRCEAFRWNDVILLSVARDMNWICMGLLLKWLVIIHLNWINEIKRMLRCVEKTHEKKTCARYLLSNRLIWWKRNSWIQIINEKFGGKKPIFNKILQSAVEGAAGSEIDRIKTNINRKQKKHHFFSLEFEN